MADTRQELYQGPERRGELRKWHLDRRVPITLIIGLVAQAAAGIWFASQQAAQVDMLIRDQGRLERRVETMETTNHEIERRLAGVEATTRHIKDQVDRLVELEMRKIHADGI